MGNTIKRKLQVVLIGVGRFGKNYLRILKKFEKQKRLSIAGLIIKTKKSKKQLQKKEKCKVLKNLSNSLLRKTDAVFIVTPARFHAKYILRCAHFCHVLCEKPIGVSSKELDKIQKIHKAQTKEIMVGHIFRWHPITKYLKSLLGKKQIQVQRINGNFISPINTDHGEDPVLEHLHLFDIVDYIFQYQKYAIWAENRGRIRDVHWRVHSGPEGRFNFGWNKNKKERFVEIEGLHAGKNFTYKADFLKNKITIQKKKSHLSKTIYLKPKEENLKKEIRSFLKLCEGKDIEFPNSTVGIKIAKIALNTKRSTAKSPKVGIVGAGVFGLTCALALPSDIKITLLDENREVLKKASYANQYRHHAGFHYPRSEETIQEILESEDEFRGLYGDLIVSNFPSYYAIAKAGSKISPDAFLRVCNKFKMWYREAQCPKEYLNPNLVSLIIETKESVYDYKKMKLFFEQKLSQKTNITTALHSRVTNIRLLDSGQKQVTYMQNGKQIQNGFDYLINATYANVNQWCDWLRFQKRDLIYRVKELVNLNISPNSHKCAVTIMDGDFATLVPQGSSPTGYTLGDVPLSIHEEVNRRRYEARFRDWTKGRSTRWPEMQNRCLEWFPILKRATYVSSMFVTLPVEQRQMETDGRPTIVTDHGFGCWSVLSGKIMTSAKAAKVICEGICQTRTN